MTNRFWVLVFVLMHQLVLAQYKFSADPAVFPQDVNAMMATTKNPQAIAAAASFATAFASFSPEHQKKIIETSQKLSKTKKLKAFPQFNDFFISLTAAKNKNISNSNIDTLLLITSTIADKYDGKQLQDFMATIRNFLEHGYLYKSTYNSLRFAGGDFSFRMVQAKEPDSYIEEFDEKLEQQTDTASKKTLKDAQQDFFSDWDVPVEEDAGFGTITDESKEEVNVLDVGYAYPPQPPIDGAIIEFKNADLVFVTPKDSSLLKGTNGSLLLKNGIFVGKGGTMDWHAAGLASTEVWAEMREFNFPVKSAKLISEGARLHYPSKADSTVEGVFEFRENKGKSDVQYPRFKSFKSDVDVKGFDQNIKYRGGFSMNGKHIYSSSIDEGFATITIEKEGKPRIRAVSAKFELGDSLITTNYCGITLYMEEDSITHPGTAMKYNKKNQTLYVTKQPGFNYAPFIDTYHRLEIITDAIQWDLNKKAIDLNIINAKNHIPATFESDEFFHADKFFKLKGLYRFHPLQVVCAYSDKIKSTTFYAADVAASNKLELNTFKGSMVQLMKLGYIDYNIRTGLIQLRPKAKHYVLSSRNKKDYDNVFFVSLSPNAVNATLDLETHELHVRGVDRIYISDSLKVNLTPDNKEIKIEKNRNFRFTGQINTETFQFVGQDFRFVYDSFLVHMPKIDQIRLAVSSKKRPNPKDTAQMAGRSRVLGNELRYSSGTLYINKPDNKSARKKFAQYPIFDATSGASVFFNKKNINGGVYDTTIKFEIPPFRLDSLSSDDPHSIGFEGTFKSGGIFPEFKEKLVVMPDYSLGFKHKVPRDGYQVYTGSGKFYSTVTLDGKGIRGEGEIKYLTTQLYSKDFIFYKDSVKTEGTKYITKPGTHPDALPTVKYPIAKASNYRLKWLPYQDSMFVSNSKEPINMYDSTATMQGTVNIRKTAMLGRGVVFTRGSITESKKLNFEQTKFTAREAKFQIESDDPDKPAVLGINDKIDFDLDKRLVSFTPEIEGDASNSFPYVEYRSSLQEAVWDLDKKNVILSVKDSSDISKSYFYSTRKDQDSLVFNATHALYDIPKQVLNIRGVPFIHVADAKIFPDSNKVRIEQNAVMTTLRKAKLEIDTTHKYHYLYDGTVDIKSRLKFEGVATYRYVNLGDDTLAISFQDFRTEPGRKKKEGMHTVATGLVKEDDKLFIGPKIIYKGKVTMFAESPYLVFDGYLKLDLKGALSYSEWLKYTNDGETKEVKIDLKNAVSDNGTPLSTGMHLDKRTNQLYTTFISKKVNQTDPDFFLADKAFEFDLDSNEFRVGSIDKFHHKSQEGNNLIYNDTKSEIRYSGKYTLLHLPEKDESVKLLVGGDGSADINKSEYNFKVLMSFNPKIHAKVTDAIGKDLKGVAQMVIDSIPDSTLTDPLVMAREEEIMTHKIGALAGNSGVQKYKDGKATGAPMSALNSEFAKAFLFSNVKFKWSPAYKAFYSVGRIRVESILKNEIKKEVNGYIEIRKGSKGDKITVYLEPTPNSWYYITYDENRLAVASSSESVTKAVAGRSKGEMPDRSKFFFVAAEPIEKQKFLVDFRSHYLGTTEEHQIDLEEKKEEETPVEEKKEEIDISEPEIGTETPEEETTPNPVTNKKDSKKKKKKEPTYDQYKLPDEPEDTQVPDAEEKEKPTIEDQKELKDDKQKMKDLFK